MRKQLMTLSYILCAAVYTFFSLVIYQLLKETIYDSQLLTVLNKALMIAFGAIVIGIPLLLLSKKIRKSFLDSIASIVDDFIFEILEPLKKNVKRREFWILQGYTLTRFLSLMNKFVVLVFVFPVVLFMLDSSKEVGAFASNFVSL